jgi:hypothetical protein
VDWRLGSNANMAAVKSAIIELWILKYLGSSGSSEHGVMLLIALP